MRRKKERKEKTTAAAQNREKEVHKREVRTMDTEGKRNVVARRRLRECLSEERKKKGERSIASARE